MIASPAAMKLSAQFLGFGGRPERTRGSRRWPIGLESCFGKPVRRASALLGLVGIFSANAQISTWTGGGSDDLWSNGANWTGGVPANGGSVVFGVTGGGDSILNFSLSLTQFQFAPQILPEHNFHLASGASLTLTGFGIDNMSRIGSPPNPGVIRQQMFMEEGSTLTFLNNATVSGSAPVFALPVDLVVRGSAASGGTGGRIIFEDNSTASGGPVNTFTGLRIYGGTAAGAGGAELYFRENAQMGPTAAFAIHAGEAAGAEGGTAIFEGNSVASSGSNSILSGSGQGGRLIFRENARGSASFNNSGAGTLEAGSEAVTQFLDDSVLDGFVQNFAGQGAGMPGGRTEFRQRAIFGSSNGGFIINRGSHSGSGGEGGRTVFYDDTRIAGTNITISNQTESEGPQPGSIGGVLEFLGNSRAGSATINNGGATSAAAGTLGARTLFRENSSAENATIEAEGGGLEAGAVGSLVEFSGDSTAANASITARSGTEGGAGGRIHFIGSVNGGTAKITAELGAVFDMSALTTSGTTLGAIAGAGDFFLGNKSLIVGSSNLNTEVAGVIRDGGQGGGAGASLTKVGTGILTLSGANSYTGGTTVNAGGLVVNGSIGGTGVSVANGGLIGGSGTINTAVTVADGGRLAPGAAGTFGTLTVSSLALNAGSQLDFQLRDGSHDQVAVNGPLTLDGVLNVAAPSGLTLGIYRLFDYTGAFTNNGLVLGTLPPGTTPGEFTILTGTPGQVDLVLGGDVDLLFWDGPQTTANNVVNGGTGTWINATTNWTNSGGSVQRGWNGRTAIFSGTAGTVTLGENVSVRGMQFVTSNYVINSGAGNTITLEGAAPVRVDGSGAAVNTAFGGSGTLIKTGAGSLTLNGISNHTGGTEVVDGLLIVTSATGLGLGTGPVTVRESRTSYLRFAGNGSAGNLVITNQGSATDVPGVVQFEDTATAGNSTMTNAGNTAAGGFGAVSFFSGSSRAGTATIRNLGAGFAGEAGQTLFQATSTAESATITNEAGLGAGFKGGLTRFNVSATAGTANILNRGGTVSGALGGVTDFFGNATGGTSTMTVEGGSNGGLGGTIRFNGNATGGIPRIIFLPGGSANGLLDISSTNFLRITIGSIEGNGMVELGGKGIEVGGNNLDTEFAGQISGFGGSIRKVGAGTLTLAGASTHTGDTVVVDGILQVTNPAGSGLGNAPATVFASPTSELRFSLTGSASAISITNIGSTQATFTGLTTFRVSATAGNASIVNRSSNANGALGGHTRFYGTSQAGTATIDNHGSIFLGTGVGGGELFFFESSSANAAKISNRGGLVNGSEGGQTNFLDSSTGGSATITNHPAAAVGAFQGATVFRNTSTAGTSMITNASSATINLPPGSTEFFDNATLGNATITNQGGPVAGASSGLTQFLGSSTAGAGTIFNRRGGIAGANGGTTRFYGMSLAGSATFTNEGAQFEFADGVTEFYETTNAGTAKFVNGATLTGGFYGGRTRFFDASRAGTAMLDNEGSKVPRGYLGDTTEAGETNFRGTSSADGATIINRGKTVANGVSGGIAQFFVNSKAGTAKITNEGSAFAPNSEPAGGWTIFSDSSSAEQAVIINRGPLAANGGRGETLFDTGIGQPATADRATITNEGGLFPFQTGGATIFYGSTSAGAATFISQGGLADSAFGGATYFNDNATASTATFTSDGGKGNIADGGFIFFFEDSRAGQSTILNKGGEVVGAFGGATYFADRSSAEGATLRGLPGAGPSSGGRFLFQALSDGGTARAILEGSGVAAAELVVGVSDAGMNLGSVEGTGFLSLGSKNLALGGNNLSTEFSGVIRDGPVGIGGSLTKVGTGTLVLSGDNTFTGITTVLAGKLVVSGSLAGAVNVQGGILGGNGQFNGGITVGPGGVIEPGASIGTFTTLGALTFDTGSAYGLEIDSTAGTADAFSAASVTISTGVTMFGRELGAGFLPLGMQFKIIDNTSPNPIVGTFAGLDQGAQFAVGANVFRISYTGGDGNDVTLTNLVPEPGSAAVLLLGVTFLALRRQRFDPRPRGHGTVIHA